MNLRKKQTKTTYRLVMKFQIKIYFKWNSGSLINFVYWSPHCEDMKQRVTSNQLGSISIFLHWYLHCWNPNVLLMRIQMLLKPPKDLFTDRFLLIYAFLRWARRSFEACKWCKTSPVYFYRIAQSLPVTTRIVTLICSSRALQSLHCYTGRMLRCSFFLARCVHSFKPAN